MAYQIPTLAELFARALAKFESIIGQTAPSNDKAFLKVVAAVEAGLSVGHYKYASDRAKQNLALTATGEDLDKIGNNNSVPRKASQYAIVTATLNAATGTTIPTTIDFIADANNLRYRAVVAVVAVADLATIQLQCVQSGVDGNLDIGDTLEIASQISGAETTATVTVIDQVGVNTETDSDYRPRVLFAQRAITGGANATDHKIWAEEVTGVKRAFPYSGRPADEGASYPGDRSVYIETTIDIDPDGLAPAAILDDVRASIGYNISGLARPPLGITDATLFLRSITRTSFFLEIRDFVVDPDKDSQCKAAIIDASELYFLSITPFVDGVDLVQERSDTISSITVSKIIQDVLRAYGATASSVGFGVAVGVFLTSYVLGQGELAKLGGVSYA